ncbi:serine hydrolase domain-containing protein [Mariniradius sediminis]|uniref:Beta-lactamase family protein n=1 Tax=Mariniradius sediminis TaxID=2909237 RepID=A0ABS9BRP6_9BACT|nr:serine hydrolase domain-containing protein [Mariniradius sediminis]MCF1750746.1 beta-lactamase family protein [Mariniradius sediminis]
MKTLFPFAISFMILSSCSRTLDPISDIFIAYQGENPGAVVAIIQNGKVVYQNAFGQAELENLTPVQPNTNFRLASVSKQFTATAILILEQRGLLDLSWTLESVFDSLPAYGKTIQIQHLLNHTSGIWDYEDFVPDDGPQVTDADVLEIVKNHPKVYFEAGSAFRYSNTAYALLALVVEKYAKMHFQDFLKSEIFDRLEMNNTLAFVPNYNEVPNRAFGYSKEDGGWVKRDQSSTSAVLGDGGIYSNVRDLFLWDQALYDEKILPKEALQKTFTKGKLNDGSEIPYGMGWHIKEYDGEKVVYHTGSTDSFRNIIYRIPSRNLSIIILTNRDTPEEENMVNLAERVISEFEERID